MSSSSDGRDFQTQITADPSQFVAGMDKAKQAAATASDQINSQFKKIGDTVNAVNKYMMGFVAVLAGGGALKKFISDANEWNGAAGKMAIQLGISTEKASVLNVALQRLGMDSDTYLGASQKLSKQIHSNAQAFETLGVQVKDATGNYRPVTEVMGEVNKKLAEIKNPIEQNIAGQQVYGKGWSEVRGILRLTTEQMAESERRARELGLIVGPEGAAMSKQYSMQMRDLGLVGKSLEVQFGNALLPAFTRMGAFMSQEGPAAGQVFAHIIEGVGFAAASTWLALKDMGDGIGALAAQAAALLSGDIEGFKAIGAARDAEAAKNEAAYEKLKTQFGQPLKPATGTEPNINTGKHYSFGKEGEDPAAKSRMAAWEAKLSEDKAALTRQGMQEGQYREMSKAEELKYWNDLKAQRGLSDAEKVALARKAGDVEQAMIKDAFEVKVAALHAESEQYRNNMEAKLAIEREIQSKYAEGTKQYEEAQKRIIQIQRQAAEQEKQISVMRAQAVRDAAMSELQGQQQIAQMELDMGVITHQEFISKQADFETKKNAIVMDGLAERLKIAELDPDRNLVEIERIHEQIEQAEREHQLRLGQIRIESMRESQKYTMDAINAMGSGFQSVFQKTLQGTTSLRGAMQGMWQATTQAVSQALAKMAADWLMVQLKNMIFGKIVAQTTIAQKSAEAGAGGVASMAAAPFPINLGAPAFGAAMAAASSAFSALAAGPGFAVGSWEVPQDMFAKIHKGETIVPTQFAEKFRDGGSGSGGSGDTHVHITAMDARSVRDYFKQNSAALAPGLRNLARNFTPSKA